MCRTLGVEHNTTTAYHPQSNGMVERFRRVLKAALRARGSKTEWDQHLPWALQGIRAQAQEEAGSSSTEAALGVQLQLPGVQLPREPQQPPQFKTILSTIRSYAEMAATPPVCAPGDIVFLCAGPAGPALSSPYSGPFCVADVRGKAVQLQMGQRKEWVSMD